MYVITTEREYPADVVRQVIAMALSVDPDTVVMIQSVEDLTRSVTGSTCCLLTRRGGQFAQTMEIYPSSRLTLPEEELARTVCVVLNCRALISDEGVNPYAWDLVDQHGSITPVFVEPEALDKRDEFVLAQRQGGDVSAGVTSGTARHKRSRASPPGQKQPQGLEVSPWNDRKTPERVAVMADLPSGYHQRERIKEALPRLSQRQRAAFAAACAERVMPVLENYFGDNSLCESAIVLVWRFATDGALDDGEAKGVLERCEELVAGLYEDDERGAALAAANAAIFALESARQPQSKFAEAAAADAQDAAETDTPERALRDQYVEEEANWQMRALDLTITTPAPTRDMFAPLGGEPQWLRTYRREKWIRR